ncbi:unnamed protein product [Heterobilharzia americana]|nr:unnamed protein product [Heterobilharzia americana]
MSNDIMHHHHGRQDQQQQQEFDKLISKGNHLEFYKEQDNIKFHKQKLFHLTTNRLKLYLGNSTKKLITQNGHNECTKNDLDVVEEAEINRKYDVPFELNHKPLNNATSNNLPLIQSSLISTSLSYTSLSSYSSTATKLVHKSTKHRDKRSREKFANTLLLKLEALSPRFSKSTLYSTTLIKTTNKSDFTEYNENDHFIKKR